MDFSFKKMVTKLGKILVGLLLLVFVIIAIALNFVFTPEKITPKVVEAINKNLKGELKVKNIELSFFKTFPNFTLEVEQGSIVNHLNDSVCDCCCDEKRFPGDFRTLSGNSKSMGFFEK